MTTEISTAKKREIESKIKMQYTKNKIKSLVKPINTNDRINLSRFVTLTNRRLKVIENKNLQTLYSSLLLQAKVAIEYNRLIENKIASGKAKIDIDLLLYSESEIIKEQLQTAIDKIIEPIKDNDNALSYNIVILDINTSLASSRYAKSQNKLIEYMTNPIIYDMHTLYQNSKPTTFVKDLVDLEDPTTPLVATQAELAPEM